MSINAKKPDGDTGNFKKPTGTFQAVCQSVHDIGVQEVTWQGKVKHLQKAVVVWEITERIKDGDFKDQRYVFSKTYTVSLAEKANLRKDLESWRGKAFSESELSNGFDIEKLIGVNCMLSITETVKGDKTYANVSAVMGLPNNMPKITPELPQNHVFKWIEEVKKKAINPTPASEPVNPLGIDFDLTEEVPF